MSALPKARTPVRRRILEEELSSPSPVAEEEKEEDALEIPPGFVAETLGVNLVIRPIRHGLLHGLDRQGMTDRLNAIKLNWRSFRWFVRELYILSPTLSLAWVACQLVWTLLGAAATYISSTLFSLVEIGLLSGSLDSRRIIHIFLFRVFLQVSYTAADYVESIVCYHFEDKVRLHFRWLNLQLRLKQDQDKDVDGKARPLPNLDPWAAAWQLFDIFRAVISTITSVFLIYRLVLAGSGSQLLGASFVAFTLLKSTPIFESELTRFWRQESVYYCVNKAYNQLRTFEALPLEGSKNHNIMSLGLDSYITKCFKAAFSQLEGMSIRVPSCHIFHQHRSFLQFLSINLSDEVPSTYYVFAAICGWTMMSFSTITSVESLSRELKRHFLTVLGKDGGSSYKILAAVREFHTALERAPTRIDGVRSYPSGTSDSKGMGIELRNVTFTYPADTSLKPAIRDCSFSISPGHLVVIVGGNGSGKSSLMKLLTRAYEPNSGDVLFDGSPAKDYKLRDLREATAVLAQDHELLEGLSIKENVGLGRWQHADDEDLICQSLELGGAQSMVAKFKKRLDTILKPAPSKCSNNVQTNDDAQLKSMFDDLEKHSEVSGGEQQRLVAARTFMRMNTGDVKLVLVDEPSSAMDPQAEHRLFQNLRKSQAGKTLICITHRFGHLTKYADLIICLKDGLLVEQGSHKDLMDKRGEYFNMYSVQAQGFSTGTTDDC